MGIISVVNSTMDAYQELIVKANTHSKLYHYTTTESLNKIKEFGSLRLTRLDYVNDPVENQRIKSIWHSKIFVACFSHTAQNDEYFKKYYNSSERITLCSEKLNQIETVYEDCSMQRQYADFMNECSGVSDASHTTYNNYYDWVTYDISLIDVKYVNNLDAFSFDDGTESNAGLIKQATGQDRYENTRHWDIEQETRLRVALRPKGYEYVKEDIGAVKVVPCPIKYLYMPIYDCIDDIAHI